MNTTPFSYLIPFLSLLLVTLFIPQNAYSITNAETLKENCTFTLYAPLTLSEVETLTRQEVETKLNRTFSIKEKFEFWNVKRMVKNARKKNTTLSDCEIIEKKARLSFLFGIIGIFTTSFAFIFGLLGIAKSRKAIKLINKKPDCPELKRQRKKAKIGMTMGIINVIFSGFLITLFTLAAIGQ